MSHAKKKDLSTLYIALFNQSKKSPYDVDLTNGDKRIIKKKNKQLPKNSKVTLRKRKEKKRKKKTVKRYLFLSVN